jgi:hypothetical protein
MAAGKRRSAYAIKAQRPLVGWLHYEVEDAPGVPKKLVEAKLLSETGSELAILDHARLVACRGQKGALLEGVEWQRRGTKHSTALKQAWWCEAPPRTKPLLDHQVRILAAESRYLREKLAGWGND